MPRIPAFEDIGNKPLQVTPEQYFSVIAAGLVEQYAGADVWTECEPDPGTQYDPDPYAVIAESRERAAGEAIAHLQYRAHVALHSLWAKSFDSDEGMALREMLDRCYLMLKIRNQYDLADQLEENAENN